jgi:hypothetical protein
LEDSFSFVITGSRSGALVCWGHGSLSFVERISVRRLDAIHTCCNGAEFIR